MFKFSEVLLSPRQSTTCLSSMVSTAPQPGLTVVAGDTDALDVRTVTVAAAGMINKACAAVSTQNWHISEAVKPVNGMPGVNVAVEVIVIVTVDVVVEVLVKLIAVKVAWAIAVGVTC